MRFKSTKFPTALRLVLVLGFLSGLGLLGTAQDGPPGIIPPVTITFQISETDQAHWILPGPRELDPGVFGTPEMPLGFEEEVGVPLDNRVTNDAGTAYTTTGNPTPHSNNVAMVTGSVDFSVTDATAVDSSESMDTVAFESTFSGPGESPDRFRVVVSKVIPVGPHHSFFGGVVSNAFLHGRTGIGTKLQPQQFVYAGFWGVGQLYRNDEIVADNQVVHVMLSQRVRTPADEGYELVPSDRVNELSGKQVHVILPPTMVTPDGPQERPVPTGFMLPNGEEQPFLHIMFDEVGAVSGAVQAN